MIKFALLLSGIGSEALAEPITVPSGQLVEFSQVIWAEEAETPNAVFRFVAPEISRDGTGIKYDKAVEDLLFLCNSFALPRVLKVHEGREVDLVLSFSQQDVAFGEMNADNLQFFESFVVRDDACDWGNI